MKNQLKKASTQINGAKNSISANSRIINDKCEICGKDIKQAVFNAFGVTRHFKIICPCRKEEFTKQDQEMIHRQKQEKLERLFNQSRLGKRFKTASFEKFQTGDDSIEIFNIIKDFAYNFKNKYKEKSIIMYGKTGTGKTLLASSVVNHLIQNNISAIFVVVPDMLTQIRNSFGNHDFINEKKILEGLSDCELLVMDDLGSEHHKEKEGWAAEKLYQIVNSRYNNLKSTIFTTNCTMEELYHKIGHRIFSRIVEMTDGYKFDMSNLADWRMKKFQ